MGRPNEDDEKLCGTVVASKYRVDRLIGRGGMGAVYEATNTVIGKRVALKFLDKDAARDADAVARFQREAEAAGAVESAHIVHIFDSGVSEDDRPFLVMELLSGEDLRALLKREGRMPLTDAIHVTGQVLRALARAHAAGIVHRDLKPDNVFLCRRDDDPMFVKLVDFGISKVTRRHASADTLTRRGVVLGTAFYMSPEQAQALRDIDGRTDLFSVGAILFEALAGRPPHVGAVYEAVLIDICTKDAPDIRSLVPEVPEGVASVLKRALARDRDQRFADANDFYDALSLAAPGLLRTGGIGLVPSARSSSPDTAPIIPGAISGPSVTAEGTAVRPSSANPKTQTHRTVVTAVVAALGAFALTALFMARSGNSNETRSLAPPSGSGDTRQPEAPSASATHTEASPGGDVDAGSATKPIRVGKPSAKPASSAGPAQVSSSGKASPAGVATGLTLDTRGP